MTHQDTKESRTFRSAIATPTLLLRGFVGGVLMGLANLVPGISGGTMLLASGIYPRFIEAIAEVTTLRFRFRSLLVLGVVAGSALVGIVLLAGLLKELVVERRWAMYSLFIGLTLGGVPIVWRLARPANRAVLSGALGGFVGMAALAWLQSGDASGSAESNFPLLFTAGLAGASAMILPGISGGYLLLLLGQYIPILSAIDRFKEALESRDLAAAMEPALSVLLPVGIGVVAGVVVVSNLLRFLLDRYAKATLGVLLGLLIGAVVGLWPFRQTVEPELGKTRIKGQTVTAENLEQFDREDYPTATFQPTPAQLLGSLSLIALGTGITVGVSRIGGEEPRGPE